MRNFLWVLTVGFILFGCSTQKNDQPQPETAAEANAESMSPTEPDTNTTESIEADATLSGAKAVVPGEKPVMKQAIELPFQIALSAAPNGEETVVTLTVDYKTALSGSPVLRLTPKGDTEIVGTRLEQQLETPSAAGQVTKAIRLRGTNPGVDVSVSLVDNGFGVEVHDTWPPKRVVHESPQDMTEPLPAPIVVDGMEIERGVRVRPE